MKSNDIKEGVTYTFVATDAPARKHLEGQPFTVVRIANVWRRIKLKGSKRVRRFFNEAGDGARADELEPRDVENPAEKPVIDDLPF